MCKVQHKVITKSIFKLVGLLSMDEASHLRELQKERTGRDYHATNSSALVHTSLRPPHLGADIMSDHLLNHHVGECLKVLDELLVLVISGLLLHEELKERSLLPADPRDICSFLCHPEQQP